MMNWNNGRVLTYCYDARLGQVEAVVANALYHVALDQTLDPLHLYFVGFLNLTYPLSKIALRALAAKMSPMG